MVEAARGRYRDAFQHRDFRLLTGATLVDQVGGWAYSVVLAVYLFDRTGSTQVLALSAASRWIPALLVAGYAGVLADRYERTRVMKVSAGASAVVMAALTAGVALDAPVPLLIALSGLQAVILSPYVPAAGALTPEVVGEKDLAAANGVFSTLENLVVVIGPGIGGLLLLVGSPELGVAVNAASFVVALLIVSRLEVRSTGGAAAEDGNAFAQWRKGVQTLARHRTAVILVVFCALDSAIYGASTVLFVPLSLELGTGSEGYSYLLAASALGCVIGAGLANRLSASSQLAPVILGSIVLQALPYLALVVVGAPAVAVGLLVVSGVGMIVVDVLAITALQRDLPRDVLSRVLGVFDALVLAAIVAASFAAEVLLSRMSLDVTLAAVGIGIPALALLGLPVLLRADRESAEVAQRLRPRVELLSALDLFSGVGRSTLERLAAQAEEVSLAAHSVVLREGEEADALWLLVSGSLSVEAKGERDTASQLPTVVAPGYVGELGLLHKVPRTATVETLEGSTLLRIEGADFLATLADARASASLMSIAGLRMARTAPRETEE